MLEINRSKELTFERSLNEIVRVNAADAVNDQLNLLSVSNQGSFVEIGRLDIVPWVESNGLDVVFNAYVWDQFDPNGPESGSRVQVSYVNWGDGTSDTVNGVATGITHTYANPGTYSVTVVWNLDVTGGTTRNDVTVS